METRTDRFVYITQGNFRGPEIPCQYLLVKCYCGVKPILTVRKEHGYARYAKQVIWRIHCPHCNWWGDEIGFTLEEVVNKWNEKIDWRTMESNCIYDYEEYKSMCHGAGGKLVTTGYYERNYANPRVG